MKSCFNLIIVIFLISVFIGCGESGTVDRKTYVMESDALTFSSSDIVTDIGNEYDDAAISIDDSELNNDETSIKFSNKTGCVEKEIIHKLLIPEAGSYNLSFYLKRTGDLVFMDGCGDYIIIFSSAEITVLTEDENSKAGVPVEVSPTYLEISIHKSGNTLVSQKIFLEEDDFWEQQNIPFSTDSTEPLSISLKCEYEQFWLNTLQIDKLN